MARATHLGAAHHDPSVRWVDDPVLGQIPIPGFPFKFGDQPQLPEIRAPFLGEHNAAILQERLGLSEERIAELVAGGVLFDGGS